MVNFLMSGCNGRMGQAIVEVVGERTDAEIVCGVDTYTEKKNGFPVYADFTAIAEKPDVIIDFSNPTALEGLLSYAVENNVPCVLCTTGYNDAQIDAINKAAEKTVKVKKKK